MKLLTGGDTLTARFMRQDHFTFTPTHHLWLMGNHQPQVRAGGDSFWRRLRLVPFTRTVPPGQAIENLSTILVAEEGPGILAWIVAGASAVFRPGGGLAEPESVMAATRVYAAEEDALGRFLGECCHFGGGDHVRTETKVLRASYERWCHAEGETPIAPSPFGRELKQRGITSKIDSRTADVYMTTPARTCAYAGVTNDRNASCCSAVMPFCQPRAVPDDAPPGLARRPRPPHKQGPRRALPGPMRRRTRVVPTASCSGQRPSAPPQLAASSTPTSLAEITVLRGDRERADAAETALAPERAVVAEWIRAANDGEGKDVDDLMYALEHAHDTP
ncbi:phage/plasmid primase, P4 family [Embleya sp. NPDC008237]|uniref:phage/plasmid primase, P4 family n=1 Tax=Embleya sp. NPDC008237 TaxID=3363978 RepID=UPI0036F173F7